MKNTAKHIFWLGLGLWLLAGCNSWLPDYRDRDTGYRLILQQSITIPPERTRVFIQQGQILPSQGFDEYETSCNIEVRKRLPTPQTIEPDTFVVGAIHSLIEEVAHWRHTQVASVGLAGVSVDSSPSNIFMGWHFWLYSPRQPDVIRLTCRGVFAEPWEAYPPTLAEITQALGSVARLQRHTPDAQSFTLQPGQY